MTDPAHVQLAVYAARQIMDEVRDGFLALEDLRRTRTVALMIEVRRHLQASEEDAPDAIFSAMAAADTGTWEITPSAESWKS